MTRSRNGGLHATVWFTFRTVCARLATLLEQLGGRRADTGWVDVFISPYVNCECVQGSLSNMAGRRLVAFLHDKRNLGADALGVAPPTFADANAVEAARAWPVIVKPPRGTNGKNRYAVCHNRTDLERAVAHAGSSSSPWTSPLIQQFVTCTRPRRLVGSSLASSKEARETEPERKVKTSGEVDQLEEEDKDEGGQCDVRVFGLLMRQGEALLCNEAVVKWYHADASSAGARMRLSQLLSAKQRAELQRQFDAVAAACSTRFGDARALAQWFSADVIVDDDATGAVFVLDINPMSALGTVLAGPLEDAERAVWTELLGHVRTYHVLQSDTVPRRPFPRLLPHYPSASS